MLYYRQGKISEARRSHYLHSDWYICIYIYKKKQQQTTRDSIITCRHSTFKHQSKNVDNMLSAGSSQLSLPVASIWTPQHCVCRLLGWKCHWLPTESSVTPGLSALVDLLKGVWNVTFRWWDEHDKTCEVKTLIRSDQSKTGCFRWVTVPDPHDPWQRAIWRPNLRSNGSYFSFTGQRGSFLPKNRHNIPR